MTKQESSTKTGNYINVTAAEVQPVDKIHTLLAVTNCLMFEMPRNV
jgi:hypothetical protein